MVAFAGGFVPLVETRFGRTLAAGVDEAFVHESVAVIIVSVTAGFLEDALTAAVAAERPELVDFSVAVVVLAVTDLDFGDDLANAFGPAAKLRAALAGLGSTVTQRDALGLGRTAVALLLGGRLAITGLVYETIAVVIEAVAVLLDAGIPRSIRIVAVSAFDGVAVFVLVSPSPASGVQESVAIFVDLVVADLFGRQDLFATLAPTEGSVVTLFAIAQAAVTSAHAPRAHGTAVAGLVDRRAAFAVRTSPRLVAAADGIAIAILVDVSIAIVIDEVSASLGLCRKLLTRAVTQGSIRLAACTP